MKQFISLEIDPLLMMLERRLQGIVICSLPMHGPAFHHMPRLAPMEERYTVYGLADDVKASVSSMAEFDIIEEAAHLFERSSGNQLHRDPVKGKCKVLALGRWRNTLQQEDIRQPHFRLSDTLSMVGVELMASWQQTRNVNNEEVLRRLKSTINSWKSGKFMPLVCRPFSLNTYCLSKAWFRSQSVDLRAGDVTAYTRACKSWLYQDMLEKPSELLLYRPTEEGGLGLFHVQCKALSGLIATFLQTAANGNFQNSLYHSILYRYYCLLDHTVPQLDPPPYYSLQFFSIIRDVVENSPLNPVRMSQKQWYKHLLEKKVTMEVVDAEDRMVPKKSKVEERHPEIDWQLATHVSRIRGLSPEIKSFNFKLVNLILPSKVRISQLLRNPSPICTMCATQVPESVEHALFDCDQNSRAAMYLLELSRVHDSGLHLIWKNRNDRRATKLYDIRAELECIVQALRKSRSRRLQESGSIISNTLENFRVDLFDM